MASFAFLKIHPILYPIISGGKGKATDRNQQRLRGLFFKQLSTFSIRIYSAKLVNINEYQCPKPGDPFPLPFLVTLPFYERNGCKKHTRSAIAYRPSLGGPGGYVAGGDSNRSCLL